MNLPATTTTSRPISTRIGPLNVHMTGSGPPVLLWHSLFVDSTTWDRLRPRFATGRQLVLIDGPNHGGNPRRKTPFTIDDCVGAAVDVLDQLGIADPVDWLGNAWGGHVGILFAAANPDRVRSLITIGTPVPGLSPLERIRITALVALYRGIGPAGFLVGMVCDALLGSGVRKEDPEAHAVVA